MIDEDGTVDFLVNEELNREPMNLEFNNKIERNVYFQERLDVDGSKTIKEKEGRPRLKSDITSHTHVSGSSAKKKKELVSRDSMLSKKSLVKLDERPSTKSIASDMFNNLRGDAIRNS